MSALPVRLFHAILTGLVIGTILSISSLQLFQHTAAQETGGASGGGSGSSSQPASQPALNPTPDDLCAQLVVPWSSPDAEDLDANVRKMYGLTNKFTKEQFAFDPEKYNFGLPYDEALGSWSSNNHSFKADGVHEYGYVQGIGLYHGSRAVTGQSEAMGYVTKSLTRAAGADLRTFSKYRDMSPWFSKMHSAQWRKSCQATNLFWKQLAEVLKLKSE